MPTQLALSFDAVPVTCEVQQRYHSIAPCLAGIATPAEQAQTLNLGYSTVTRWLREFRDQGMPGLFPATQYPREPYTPERVIVQLIFFKCCAPKAGDRELARVIHHLTEHQLHLGLSHNVLPPSLGLRPHSMPIRRQNPGFDCCFLS